MDGTGNKAPGSATTRILVVDDSRTNLSVMGHRLGALGYLPVLSERGDQALDLVAGGGFDLVLLDLVMPGLSGFDVLREIRGASTTADLPVIMVTTRSDPEGAVEALGAGADDYVAKPFPFDVLAARIERILARSRRMASLKRVSAALDARVADRAIALGEARGDLAEARAEQLRLRRSVESLIAEVDRLSGRFAPACYPG